MADTGDTRRLGASGGARKRTMDAPRPTRNKRTKTLLNSFLRGEEEAFIQLDLGDPSDALSDCVPMTPLREFAHTFVPKSLLHLRVITRVCGSLQSLSRQLLRAEAGRPSPLEAYLQMWLELDVSLYSSFVEVAVRLFNTIYRQIPNVLRRWVTRRCNAVCNYCMTPAMLHCLEEGDCSLFSPPYTLGLGIALVLQKTHYFRNQLQQLLSCEFVILPDHLDTQYQSHQHLLLELDLFWREPPMMMCMAMGRSTVDLHRRLMLCPCVIEGMRESLATYLDQDVLDVNQCKVIFLIGSWFSHSRVAGGRHRPQDDLHLGVGAPALSYPPTPWTTC